MPRGFIPDTGKPRPFRQVGLYLQQSVQARFWFETITTNQEHIDYLWDSEEKQSQTTEPTIEINMAFLDDTFDQLPDDAKTLMDITLILSQEFEGHKERFSSIYGSEGGSATHEYKPIAGRYGTLELRYNWSSSDEGYVYEEEHETYSVPGVIHHNYRYYGLTREFIDWCQEQGKPKRAKWFRQLIYAE